MSARLLLYGTTACALCEEARTVVAPLAVAFGWALEEVDVALDDGLFARYGESVPVLRRTDLDAELRWPFDAQQAHALIARPRRH